MRPGSPLPDEFRPDRIGVLILLDQFRWHGVPVDALVPAGRDPGHAVLDWMQRNALRRQRPFVYQQDGVWHGFGPPDFQHEIRAKVQRGEKLW